MSRQRPSDPADPRCVGCPSLVDLRAREKRSGRIWGIAAGLVGILVSLGVVAATACTRAVEVRATVATMQESAKAASDERQRLAAKQADAEVKAAERWGEVSSRLATIDARLDSLVEQRREDRNAGR